MLRWAMLVGLGLWAASCASAGSLLRPEAKTPQTLYEQAMEDLDDGLYPEALKGFGNVKTKFPYSKYAALADLRIADTQFQRGKHIEAIDAYRNFMKYHPRHAEIPYAMLMIAESYFEQIPGDWWFLPPPSEKDQANTRLAIGAYRDLIARHPKHEQTDKARERLDECRTKLADHEMYVAEFYFDRERYAAAANRAEELLRIYGGLGHDAKALWIVGRSHFALGKLAEARTALTRLSNEFAESDWADSASGLLESLPPESPDAGEQRDG